MEENLEKENSLNPEVEDTSEDEEIVLKIDKNPQVESGETPEEIPPEEKETPEEKTEQPKEEYSERERRYYARMKKAEEEAKKTREELAKTKRAVASNTADVDAILEVQQATKGLSPEEVSELKNRASILGNSLSEARKDQNFVLWQKAWRDKVAKDKSLAPTTKQPGTEEPKNLGERLKAATTLAEKEKILTEVGFYKPPKPNPYRVSMDGLRRVE